MHAVYDCDSPERCRCPRNLAALLAQLEQAGRQCGRGTGLQQLERDSVGVQPLQTQLGQPREMRQAPLGRLAEQPAPYGAAGDKQALKGAVFMRPLSETARLLT